MKKHVRTILAVVFILVAVGCAAWLVRFYMDETKGRQANEKAQQQAQTEKLPEESSDTDEVEIPVDFASLQATNPDVYAWIRIDGTNIDYPIVQNRQDNTYYLDHTWEGTEAAQGAIFTQTYNQKNFEDYNTVVYGHRMSDSNPVMFHDLLNYMDEEYLYSHQNVTVYTEEHIFTYRIFAAVVYDDRLIPLSYNFTEEGQRQEFLDSVFASSDLRSQFAENVEVTAQDKLLTLSTCIAGEDHHRFLVEAVLTDET